MEDTSVLGLGVGLFIVVAGFILAVFWVLFPVMMYFKIKTLIAAQDKSNLLLDQLLFELRKNTNEAHRLNGFFQDRNIEVGDERL